MGMELDRPIFIPVDLNTDQEVCIRFGEDAIIASFGDAGRFHEEDGKGSERYVIWLRDRLAADPNSAVLVKVKSRIIGQINSGQSKADPRFGYVNLYYLIPEVRGQGYSRFLEEFTTNRLKGMGFSTARLSVSPTNPRAIRFYEKNGWKNIGPRPGQPEVHLMEKELS